MLAVFGAKARAPVTDSATALQPSPSAPSSVAGGSMSFPAADSVPSATSGAQGTSSSPDAGRATEVVAGSGISGTSLRRGTTSVVGGDPCGGPGGRQRRDDMAACLSRTLGVDLTVPATECVFASLLRSRASGGTQTGTGAGSAQGSSLPGGEK